jgi:hypothetical protein
VEDSVLRLHPDERGKRVYGLRLGISDSKIPYRFCDICLSNSVKGREVSLCGGGSRCFTFDLYVVGSRRMDRGRLSVMGVDPSGDGGARGSVSEKP